MAWTQSDLDKIEKAIATGARRVRFQTHEVEYQSTGDMLRARNAIKAELDAAARPGVLFAEYGGGY
jgi:hypothetical protein